MSTVFKISLNGAQQVPTVTTPYSGLGTAIYNPAKGTLAYSINFKGLDFGSFIGQPATPDTADDVNGAHFHNAVRGANGGIVFDWLTQDNDFEVIAKGNHTWTVIGTWEISEAGNSLSEFAGVLGFAAVGDDVPLYANIHTVGHLDGEIRGQLVGLANDSPDTVKGTADDETLFGLGGRDKINGLAGDDVIDGGHERDTLIGGPGDDSFLFSTTLKANNVDTVRDFSDGDVFLLDDAVFKGLVLGELDDKYFHKGKAAHDRNDRIIYDSKAGVIKYDRDGDRGEDKGKDRIIKFDFDRKGNANAPDISAEDFFVV